MAILESFSSHHHHGQSSFPPSSPMYLSSALFLSANDFPTSSAEKRGALNYESPQFLLFQLSNASLILIFTLPNTKYPHANLWNPARALTLCQGVYSMLCPEDSAVSVPETSFSRNSVLNSPFKILLQGYLFADAALPHPFPPVSSTFP